MKSNLSLMTELAGLAMDSNMVIGLRMLRFAQGGEKAAEEAMLMVTEKMQAANSSMLETTFGLASGKSMHSIGHSTVARYRKAVRSNHKRLSRT